MTRRQFRTTSRRRRPAREAELLFVLSFSEAVKRRRRPGGDARPQRSNPTLPRPMTPARLLTPKPVATSAPAPAPTRELEDA